MTDALGITDLAPSRAEVPRTDVQARIPEALRMETIGGLAAGIAHDFNNLLVIILGYGALALERVQPKDPLYGDIREIISAAEKASSLADRLLTFARGQELQPHSFSINDLISEMKSLLLHIVGKDIKLTTNLRPETGCVVADPTRIRELIMNLVQNAREAMTEGGELAIETSNAAQDDSCGPRVLLSVTDSGPGIDEEAMAHIFEPFFTTKAKSGGTGLGLAVAYDVVKQYGGNIAAHSQPGRGTSFQVFLPRARNAEQDV